MHVIFKSLSLAGALAAAGLSLPAHAQAGGQTAAAQSAAQPEMGRFITLGTWGGPIPVPNRSQPANMLLVGRDAYLIDVGDGTAEQLVKAGVFGPQVKAVVLSHLHFDHTGGLAAILGLRFQTNVTGKLQIYGPPGTRALVDGLIASMAPAAAAGYGDPDGSSQRPADMVNVTEVGDKDSFQLGAVSVTARQNTHYSFAPGSEQDKHFKSLSFRFTLPGRSIVYTGDTGPSPAVEELARGADLLVSEMIDVKRTVDAVRHNMPEATPAIFNAMTWHLSNHHLTPQQVGELAARAGVKAVVVTHFVAPMAKAGDRLGYLGEIAKSFHGPVAIANDLDEY